MASRFSRPPYWLGIHSPGLPRIIQVEHRGHGVHPQAVHVEAVAPEQRVGQQEIHHLVPAVVEDQRAPILVRPFARVFVLVERGAVEAGQRPVVAREMRRHPVNNHPDARLVQRVDQILEVLRRAVAAGRRVKARHLVAPRRVIRVLGHRHEFHVREAHLLHVLDQRLGQLAVARAIRSPTSSARNPGGLRRCSAARATDRAAAAAPARPRPSTRTCGCSTRWPRSWAASRRRSRTDRSSGRPSRGHCAPRTCSVPLRLRRE